MKANQKFVMDEEAVSPVIAVILMVAITVVLAATVFVLVSDLGGDVGQSSPKLQMVQDSTSTSTNVVVKLTDATRSAALTDYEVIHTLPDSSIVVYSLDDDTNFKGNTQQLFYSADVDTCAAQPCRFASGANPAQADGSTISYSLSFLDISGDDNFNVLDTMTIKHDSNDAEADYDNKLPSGNHKLEFRHVPTGAIAGTLTVNA